MFHQCLSAANGAAPLAAAPCPSSIHAPRRCWARAPQPMPGTWPRRWSTLGRHCRPGARSMAGTGRRCCATSRGAWKPGAMNSPMRCRSRSVGLSRNRRAKRTLPSTSSTGSRARRNGCSASPFRRARAAGSQPLWSPSESLPPSPHGIFQSTCWHERSPLHLQQAARSSAARRSRHHRPRPSWSNAVSRAGCRTAWCSFCRGTLPISRPRSWRHPKCARYR